MTRISRLVVCALFGLSLFAPAGARALSEQDVADLVKAELIAEPAMPGEPFMAAVRLRMKEHWHVYWRNPGDSGLATEIRWTLPQGYRAGEILWPAPQRIPVSHLVNFGYEHEVTLLVPIAAPANAARPATLKADVTWLACREECVPGEASLSVTLPAASSPGDGATRALFETARAGLPQPLPAAGRAEVSASAVTLRLPQPGGSVQKAFFFPNDETLIRHADPQQVGTSGADIAIAMARSELSRDVPAVIRGTLALDGKAYLVEAALQGPPPPYAAVSAPAGPAASSSAAPPPPPAPADTALLLQAVAFALLGGLILNLMPCVFPVLSIKILHVARQSGGRRARMRAHGLAYTAGVLATFVALAALLTVLRSGGAEVGWGYQLQSPLVVVALAYLFFVMALSLSGFLHFGVTLAGKGSALAERGGVSGSFFAGMLATVVATPCTAPFMGTALGVALTQPPLTGFAIFASLGLGLALPFLVLSFVPALQAMLPRPGPWMQTLQQALAFPLYATVAWLVWVVSQQINSSGLFAVLIGLVAIGLAAWLWHFMPRAGFIGRRALAASALAVLVAAGALAGMADRQRLRAAPLTSEDAFTQTRLDALRAQGRAVFVNMTAAWCITCLVNERVALDTDSVRAAMTERNIVYLKGDWTNRNPEITRLLARHRRSGVPLYLFYAAGAAEPAVLPQILTVNTVLNAFARADGATAMRNTTTPGLR